MDRDRLIEMIYNDLRREYTLERERGKRQINPYIMNVARGAGNVLYKKWEHGADAPGDRQRIRWELEQLNDHAIAVLEEHYQAVAEQLEGLEGLATE